MNTEEKYKFAHEILSNMNNLPYEDQIDIIACVIRAFYEARATNLAKLNVEIENESKSCQVMAVACKESMEAYANISLLHRD